jgi:hypothetical protein
LKNWKMKPILSAHERARAIVERRERLPVDRHFAVCRAVERAHQVQQRRFAGPGGADDRNHLAAADPQVDAGERSNLAAAVVRFRDARQFNHPGPPGL